DLIGVIGDEIAHHLVSNWGMAAALSTILLVAVLILSAVYNRIVGIDRLRIG
ncbi:ABC transporter permease, partial [Rhizobium ruizarguesonis]